MGETVLQHPDLWLPSKLYINKDYFFVLQNICLGFWLLRVTKSKESETWVKV